MYSGTNLGKIWGAQHTTVTIIPLAFPLPTNDAHKTLQSKLSAWERREIFILKIVFKSTPYYMLQISSAFYFIIPY